LVHEGDGLAVRGFGGGNILVRDLDLALQGIERRIAIYGPPIAPVDSVAGPGNLPAW
jgi:hypothetical protein